MRELDHRRGRAGRRRAGRGRPASARSFSAARHARRRRRCARRRRRRGDADDAAQREGTRVSGRVHHGTRGRALSARARRTTIRRCSRRSVGCSTSASRAPSGSSISRYAEERRRNGELTASQPSSFLDAIPEAMVEKRSTIKVRSSGRSVMRAGGIVRLGDAAAVRGRDSRRLSRSTTISMRRFRHPPRARRPGTPVTRAPASPTTRTSRRTRRSFAVGARVSHRKFGSGTIAELAGSGRDAKVKVDFDDEADRAQDARHRAGEPRARRRPWQSRSTTFVTSRRSRVSASVDERRARSSAS